MGWIDSNRAAWAETCPPVIWFLMGRRWHAEVSSKTGLHTGKCNIVVIGTPETQEVASGALYPADACMTCMKETAWDDCQDEPMDTALGRGYLPAELADP